MWHGEHSGWDEAQCASPRVLNRFWKKYKGIPRCNLSVTGFVFSEMHKASMSDFDDLIASDFFLKSFWNVIGLFRG